MNGDLKLSVCLFWLLYVERAYVTRHTDVLQPVPRYCVLTTLVTVVCHINNDASKYTCEFNCGGFNELAPHHGVWWYYSEAIPIKPTFN